MATYHKYSHSHSMLTLVDASRHGLLDT
uniref:Uncharacterized protein n=1 Tax=Arundo donax TaxID=35708 RepID=A0A0A8XNM6_ARUDO